MKKIWLTLSRYSDRGFQYRIPNNFNEDARAQEHLPAVSFGRTLSSLVKRSLGYKDWHELLDHGSKKEQEQENTKLLVLDAFLGSLGLEITEADEEGLDREVSICRNSRSGITYRADRKKRFRPDIAR